jgi:glycosyltransferase involved in cell wall biosynthesis
MLIIVATHPIQYQVPLWQKLVENGIDLEVWYLTDHGVNATFDEQFGKAIKYDIDLLKGYKFLFLPVKNKSNVNNFWNVRLTKSLKEIIGNRNVDTIWIQGWQVLAYWQIVWQANKLKILIWLRAESNDLSKRSFLKAHVRKSFLSQFFKRVDKFLFIGEANKRLYEEYNVKESKLYPSYYCVDNDRFKLQVEAIKNERELIRNNWNISSDTFCLLFVGKFIPKKHPMMLIDTVKFISKAHAIDKIHILYVGTGELGGELRKNSNVVFDADKEIKNEDGSFPKSSFAGFLNQSEVSKAYLVADCMILPSDYGETWGLVVNEAMASGLSCIVSDQCGSAENIVAEHDAELVFKFGDVKNLAEKILKMIGNNKKKLIAPSLMDKYSYNTTIFTVKKLLNF